MAEQFAAACAGGDVEALARLLHPDVEGWVKIDGEAVLLHVGEAVLLLDVSGDPPLGAVGKRVVVTSASLEMWPTGI